jgi:hypothetical protein
VKMAIQITISVILTNFCILLTWLCWANPLTISIERKIVCLVLLIYYVIMVILRRTAARKVYIYYALCCLTLFVVVVCIDGKSTGELPILGQYRSYHRAVSVIFISLFLVSSAVWSLLMVCINFVEDRVLSSTYSLSRNRTV